MPTEQTDFNTRINPDISKKTKHCQNCGREIPAEDSFCSYCGSKQNIRNKKFCMNCGYELPADAQFCSECGNKINNVKFDSDKENVCSNTKNEFVKHTQTSTSPSSNTGVTSQSNKNILIIFGFAASVLANCRIFVVRKARCSYIYLSAT